MCGFAGYFSKSELNSYNSKEILLKMGLVNGWASDLLDENRLNKEGFFNAKLIQEKWLEHQHGVHNWQYQLWPVLMFQLWLENEK